MTTYTVTFTDSISAASEEEAYTQLLSYLAECVEAQDVTAFEFSSGPQIEVTRINNDGNGNPRRVVHFTHFITDADRASLAQSKLMPCSLYEFALRKARKLGGRKFHNRQYGGGIVFQAYSDDEVLKLIARANA